MLVILKTDSNLYWLKLISNTLISWQLYSLILIPKDKFHNSLMSFSISSNLLKSVNSSIINTNLKIIYFTVILTISFLNLKTDLITFYKTLKTEFQSMNKKSGNLSDTKRKFSFHSDFNIKSLKLKLELKSILLNILKNKEN